MFCHVFFMFIAVAFALIGLVAGIRAGDAIFRLYDYGMCNCVKRDIGLATHLLIAAISLLSIVSFMGIALALQTRKISFAERRRRAALYNAARGKHGAAGAGVFSIIDNAQQRTRAQITTNRTGKVNNIPSSALPIVCDDVFRDIRHHDLSNSGIDLHGDLPLNPDMIILNTTKL